MAQTTGISIKQNWKELLSSPARLSTFIAGWLVLTAIVFVLPSFFNKIEKRNGVVLHDWVLAALPSHNFSITIFTLIYIMAFLMLYRAIQKPALIVQYVWTLVFILIARFITITLVPLNPPIGLVQLNDPVNALLFYGHTTIVKDLFFSGHTATMMLIFLSLEKPGDKLLAFLAMITIMLLLLIQHIHYTIDVVAAPFIVYGLFIFTRRLLQIFQHEA